MLWGRQGQFVVVQSTLDARRLTASQGNTTSGGKVVATVAWLKACGSELPTPQRGFRLYKGFDYVVLHGTVGCWKCPECALITWHCGA